MSSLPMPVNYTETTLDGSEPSPANQSWARVRSTDAPSETNFDPSTVAPTSDRKRRKLAHQSMSSELSQDNITTTAIPDSFGPHPPRTHPARADPPPETHSPTVTNGSVPTASASSPPAFYLIAVHGGAGAHSRSSDSTTKRALRTSIRSALPILSIPASTTPPFTTSLPATATHTQALRATLSSLSSLEDSESLNAGYGSNLTLSGHVECDASIMDGLTSTFGAVGALGGGVKNPIQVAGRLCLDQSLGRGVGGGLSLGRVRPVMLVGKGAEGFARESGMEVLGDERGMVSPRARREWEGWRKRLEEVDARSGEGMGEQSIEDGGELLAGLNDRQDTVGAIALDAAGNVAAGVSSGGLLLKDPGRVGEAAIFGAGCWAEQSSPSSPSSSRTRNRTCTLESLALSVSGTGELILQSLIAKSLADALFAASHEQDTHDILRSVLVDRFYHVWKERGEEEPNVGVLLVTKERCIDSDSDSDVSTRTPRLWCAFTTPSMAVAYASSLDPKPKAKILRNPHHTHHAPNGRAPWFVTNLPLC